MHEVIFDLLSFSQNIRLKVGKFYEKSFQKIEYFEINSKTQNKVVRLIIKKSIRSIQPEKIMKKV